MSLKSDNWIRTQAQEHGLITPFLPTLQRTVTESINQIRHNPNVPGGYEPYEETLTRPIISAGCSSYGYDIRLAKGGFRIFSPIQADEIDPKNFATESLISPPLHRDKTGRSKTAYFLLPPHAYALGVSLETFKLPDNITGLCIGKSTYARAGLFVNTTPLEAGWAGRLVLELANLANLPLRVYVHEGIAQVLFFEGDEPCSVSYADRQGKYQNQTGLTLARV